MASLQFKNIEKSYGDTLVLKGVNLDVSDGEYLVLVGPSGCGKSTLLRCVAGLEEITGGELYINDKLVNKVSPRERDVAMVFQSYALYPHMTVRENMGFGLRVARLPKQEILARVEEVAESLGLTDLLERLPGQLSGGQRQRVAMGRAVVRDPALFLFDEPLSNLDASLRSHMRLELKRLHKRLGATVIHVTHDQIEALTLADRIMVLNEGVVQQIGSPRELFDTPANKFVAAFIGSPSMNFFPCTGSNDEASVDGLKGSLSFYVEGLFWLGVRPTDWVIGGDLFSGVVEIVESLGAEALLHIDLGSYNVVVQASEPCGFTAGDTISLGLGCYHLFDRETGERLADGAL